MTTWCELGGGLQRRAYPSYAAYLAHQRRKRDQMTDRTLAAYEARYTDALLPRLMAIGLTAGARVVCLGARGGAEVRAFRALGCQATGLDLNPGPANPDVIVGDFHALPYGTGMVDVVFTNALDHGYDVDLVLSEIRRVLVPGGLLLVEAVRGLCEGSPAGSYESLTWPAVAALIEAITARGFERVQSRPFDCPWPGEHVILRRTDAS